jgi:hypothetical protein
MKEKVSYELNPHTGEERAIKDFEKLYPELAENFQEVQAEQYALFARKMMDYGLQNISLGSDLSTYEGQKSFYHRYLASL